MIDPEAITTMPAAKTAIAERLPSGSFSFRVAGIAPSKENYRRNSKDGRERWRRIKAYEKAVGLAALAASQSLGRSRKVFRDAPLSVEIGLFGQRVDLDNVKCVVDAMSGVIYRDDSQKHIRQLFIYRIEPDLQTPPSAKPPVRVEPPYVEITIKTLSLERT